MSARGAGTSVEPPTGGSTWWGWYAAAWFPFAGILFLVAFLEGYTPLLAATTATAITAVAALLGTGVWWLTGRYPATERPRLVFVGRHVVFALVYAASLITIGHVLDRARDGPPVPLLVQWVWVLRELLVFSWLYGLIAGISYAMRAQERARAQQVAMARAEALATQTQLRALGAQLNPHFLFNVLHSLSALVRVDAVAGEEAIERLGEMLRYSLRGTSDEDVALEDEWAFVRNYLALEALRLGERLNVHGELDSEALEVMIPCFTLQPLVENAIRHGIAPRLSGGTLEVRAHMEGERLVLCVKDDGLGCDPEAVASAPGLGLRTLRQRLAARYDGRADVGLDTAPGRGFSVTLWLPYRPLRVASP